MTYKHGMLLLAMDRASSGRRVDAQGFLHVDTSNISKATVNPYRGEEIPGWRELGLDARKVYRLLRHPDELAAAVGTFNKLPLLSRHVPVTCDHIPDNLIVGSTGDNARMSGDHLSNSLVVWKRGAIDGVMSNRKRQLSCAYRYTPDMTPGSYQGLQYDGIMRNIAGNHVALVIEGRAGPSVIVGDENMKLASRAALMVSGAVASFVRPLLAADAKVDLTSIFEKADATTLAMDGADASLAAQVVTLVTPHLAADTTIDSDALAAVIAAVPIVAQDDAIADPIVTPPVVKVEPVAMDAAAVQALVDKARTDALTESAAIRTAEQDVEPFVGKVIAQDSAAKVYKIALDHLKVDVSGVPETGYGALLRAMPKPSAAPRIAQDAKAGAGMLAKIAPDAQIPTQL